MGHLEKWENAEPLCQARAPALEKLTARSQCSRPTFLGKLASLLLPGESESSNLHPFVSEPGFI